jgi:alpha-L-rhamnosidase
MGFLDSISDNYILNKGWIGDWGSLVEGWKEGEPESVPTAFYFWNSRILSNVAEILKREKDSQYFKDLSLKIKKRYNEKYYDPVSKNYNDGSQMANAFPLYLGLVPESEENFVLDNLITDILDKNDGHLTTGVLGSKYMIDALTKYGREDIAYLLATQKGYPSWSDMVEKYNTMCEFWTFKQSHNHVMTGSIDAFFYKTLAGINFLDEYPGTKYLRINLYFPDNMEYVNSSIETINGTVGSSWRKSEDGTKLNIIIPVNVKAELILPESDLSKVYESGILIENNGDVQIISNDSVNSRFLVKSGKYDFFISN